MKISHEAIDRYVKELISIELENMPPEHIDFYDIKYRYRKLYDECKQELIEDEYYEISCPGYVLHEPGQYESIEEYNARVQDEADDAFDYLTPAIIEDPSKW
jgi:hypothetical protein